MPRIPLMHEDDPDTPQRTRELLEQIGQRRGQVLNVYRAMANHPALAKPFMEFYVTAREGGLTQAECELAYLSATVANDCHYWIPTHVMLGRSVGLSEAQIRHTGDDDPPEGVYSPAQAAIVRYGKRSTKEVSVGEDTYAALAAHYPMKQVMEIWALVGAANMINRFHATFHTDVDPETLEAVASGDAEAGACPLPMPDSPDSFP